MKSTRTPQYQELIERLKSTRKAAELTQQELAHRLKKPQSYVSKFENGERRLDIAEFLEIADALGVDGRALLRRPRTKSVGRPKST